MNERIGYGILFATFAAAFVSLGLTIFSERQDTTQKTSAIAVCIANIDFKILPALGPACRQSNGIYKIKLADGTTTQTHGTDPLEAIPDLPKSLPAADPVCVTNTSADYFNQMLYVRPRNYTDNYTLYRPLLASTIAITNGRLNVEAAEFKYNADYKFTCGADNKPEIKNVIINKDYSTFTWAAVISDLKSLGWNSSRAHYWIYWDGPTAPGIAGIGDFCDDDKVDSPTYTNCSNQGPRYAINVGAFLNQGLVEKAASLFMHENGHNMGAVQFSAPHSVGSHCNDSEDFMCLYPGVPGYINNQFPCPERQHFDCKHDDYFHPNPSAGSYLATHWNIGHSRNRFLSIKPL